MVATDPTTRLARNLHMLRVLVDKVLERQLLESMVGTELTFEQLNVLKFIAAKTKQRGPASHCVVGQVARHLQVSFPAATKSVARLKDAGWIEMSTGKDGRERRLRLTRRARTFVQRHEKREREELRAIGPDTEEAVLAWNETLEQVVANLVLHSKVTPCLRCGTYALASKQQPQCEMMRLGHKCPVTSRDERRSLSAS